MKAKTAGQILADERERRGLTGYELAKKAGINKQTLWSFENGSCPSFDVVRRVAAALGISLDELNRKLPPVTDRAKSTA